MTKNIYNTPTIEMWEVATEQGIAISNEGYERQSVMYDFYLLDDEE